MDAYLAVSFSNQIIQLLEKEIGQSKLIALAKCSVFCNSLTFKNLLQAPDYKLLRLKIITLDYDFTNAGHVGKLKTIEPVLRKHHWLTLQRDVERYVAKCLHF